jgi:hypothetical protein
MQWQKKKGKGGSGNTTRKQKLESELKGLAEEEKEEKEGEKRGGSWFDVYTKRNGRHAVAVTAALPATSGQLHIFGMAWQQG